MSSKETRRQGNGAGGLPKRRKVLKGEVYGAVCREILRLLETQNTVTADDIKRRLEIPKEGMSQVAHAFRGLQSAGEIILMQIIRTDRPGQNGNRIGVWRRA